jgi:hypothetical protein
MSRWGSVDGVGPTARFYFPTGITTDGKNLYVVDLGNNLIRKIINQFQSGKIKKLIQREGCIFPLFF